MMSNLIGSENLARSAFRSQMKGKENTEPKSEDKKIQNLNLFASSGKINTPGQAPGVGLQGWSFKLLAGVAEHVRNSIDTVLNGKDSQIHNLEMEHDTETALLMKTQKDNEQLVEKVINRLKSTSIYNMSPELNKELENTSAKITAIQAKLVEINTKIATIVSSKSTTEIENDLEKLASKIANLSQMKTALIENDRRDNPQTDQSRGNRRRIQQPSEKLIKSDEYNATDINLGSAQQRVDLIKKLSSTQTNSDA